MRVKIGMALTGVWLCLSGGWAGAAFQGTYYSYVMGNAITQSDVIAIEEAYIETYQMLENGYPYPLDPVAAAEADGVITASEMGFIAAIKDYQESQGQYY